MKNSRNLTFRTRRSRKRRAARISISRSFLIVLTLLSAAAAGFAGLGFPELRPGVERLYAALGEWFGQSNGSEAQLLLSREYIYADSRLLAVDSPGQVSGNPSDLAVFRPSTGTWWTMNGITASVSAQVWGVASDTPVLGDFDGDGNTDFAVFRGSDGSWWVLRSVDGSVSSYAFGIAGDVPAPADFDGDGRTDLAVWRQANGTWYMVESASGAPASRQLGVLGDLPCPADFDGDGVADPAVWRQSQGVFRYLASSSSEVISKPIDGGRGIPVPADYDGDGRDDPAVRDGRSWTISSSLTNTVSVIEWQEGNEIPVQNDFDGDGKVDIAVWRPTDGMWLIRNSGDGTTRSVRFGLPGDIPVPASFRR